jgi:hypothetical protein
MQNLKIEEVVNKETAIDLVELMLKYKLWIYKPQQIQLKIKVEVLFLMKYQ